MSVDSAKGEEKVSDIWWNTYPFSNCYLTKEYYCIHAALWFCFWQRCCILVPVREFLFNLIEKSKPDNIYTFLHEVFGRVCESSVIGSVNNGYIVCTFRLFVRVWQGRKLYGEIMKGKSECMREIKLPCEFEKVCYIFNLSRRFSLICSHRLHSESNQST